MKKNLFVLLVISLLIAGPIFSAANTGTDTNTSTDTSTEGSTSNGESLVPDNVAMTLDFKDNANVMPNTFRGGDPDSSLVHCLEDVYYEKHEHSLIYSENASDVTPGSTFESDPNITWTTSKKDADGNFTCLGSKNTNMAKDGGTLYEPGEYQIGNSGARQVNEPTEEVKTLTDTSTSTSTGTGTGTGTGTSTGTSTGTNTETTSTKEPKTVTSNQTMGVLVHDCTSPDLWVAFQEGAGNVDMAASEHELKQNIYTKVLTTMGRPFSSDEKDYEEESYIFIDEGESSERNKEPWNKTARVTIAGAMFNENGAVKYNSGVVQSGLLDKNDQTRQVHVSAIEENGLLKGIFVRRNVPFIFAAVSVDNGDERVAPTDVEARIEKGNASVVEKIDNAYLFRVPNYPRKEYEDQPNYFFVAKAEDKSGNLTTIKIPLYVINSNASFETSSK